MRRFTSRGEANTSNPAIFADPSEGGRKPVSIRMVVDLPAPLGPKNPRISPSFTAKERFSTAVLSR